MNADQVRMRRAKPGETGQVLAILDEAAAWLAARGVRQWPPRFQRKWIEAAVRDGYTWLATTTDDTVLATITLDWADGLWTDRPDSAAYVHRLAVRRTAAGLGSRLLDWAAEMATARGRHFLRLDCVASNHRLRHYYEEAGFQHRGDVHVTGPPGSRGDKGPAVTVSRYERPIETPDADPVTRRCDRQEPIPQS